MKMIILKEKKERDGNNNIPMVHIFMPFFCTLVYVLTRLITDVSLFAVSLFACALLERCARGRRKSSSGCSPG